MPERIQQRRTRGWRKPAGAVSVARPSKFGNPFPVGGDVYWVIDGGSLKIHVPDRATAVQMYRRWMARPGKLSPYIGIDYPPDVSELRGRDLLCFCPVGEPCHADVLIEIANS